MSSSPFYWTTIRLKLWCSLGGHWATSGQMRFTKGDNRRLGACGDCLKERGVSPPQPEVVLASDISARRIGESD